MALSTTTARVELAGDGSTTAFSFPYKYISSSDFKVYLFTIADGSSALKALSTDYTVTPTASATNGVYPGATITFTTAPTSAYKVVIIRDPANTQSFDFNAEADPLPVLTRSADNDAMRYQSIASSLSRALVAPPGSVLGSFSPTLPDPTGCGGGEVLAINTAKTAIIWATGVASGVISSTMANFVSSASKSAARTELAVPGLADANTFTNFNKIVVPYTTTGDSMLEVTNGTSGNPVTTIQSKHSGVRVERYLNKTAGASSTQENSAQADALSAGCFVVRKTSGSQQTFALKGIITLGTPRTSGVGANTDTVGVYGEAQRTTGSDGVWAANFLCEVTNLSGPSIGVEIDFNNRSASDPGLTGSIYALSIVNGDQYRGGTAIIVNRNGGYSNNEFNRGLYVKEYKKVGIQIGNAWDGAETNACVLANQRVDGEDTILLRRLTDTTPTGYFWRAVNAANSQNLLTVDVTGATIIGTSPGALGQKLTVQGFAVFGTNAGIYGLAGDVGGSNYVIGAVSNHTVEIRANNTAVATFAPGGAVGVVGAMQIKNATAIPAGGTAGAGYLFSSTSNFGMFFGSGAPTLSAAKGSLYLRSDGSSTSTRAYINTDGSTTWTAITTAA